MRYAKLRLTHPTTTTFSISEEVFMEKTDNQNLPSGPEQDTTLTPADKQPWQEPKLAYVEPKVTAHGDLKQVTGDGFFGGFTPR
jgi:hypothetical protein